MLATPQTYQQTNGNATENSNLPRAQLSHAIIDVDFFDNPRVEALAFKYGDLAATAFLKIILRMSRATNAEIDIDVVWAVFARYKLENPEEVLKYLLERKMLEKTSSGMITQARVIQDQEACAKKRKKWRDDKADSATPSATDSTTESAVASTSPPPRIPPRNPLDSVKTEESEDLNTEDLKDLENGLTFPPDTPPSCTAALRRWADWCHSEKLRPFGQQSAEALLMSYAPRFTELTEAINFSIGQRYKKLVDKPPGPQQNGGIRGVSKHAQNVQNAIDLAQKFREQGE